MATISTNPISGPFGGNGGDFWSFRPVNKIDQIVLSYISGRDDPIAITFSSTRPDGSKDAITVGGTGPGSITRSDTVNIGANEYLTGISGTFGTYLQSITFTTNSRVYGPYGPNVGTPFTSMTGYEVVGFLGRSGFYIDAIGIFYN